MTRVLAVSSSYPLSPTDTTAPFVRAISHGVAGHGLDVHLLLPHHDALAWGGADGPVRLSTYRYRPEAWEQLQVWGYGAALESDVAIRREAALVAPLALGATAGRLASLARRLDPDVLHAHWVVPSGVPAALVSVLTGSPLVLSLHGSDVYVAERWRSVGLCARAAFRRAAATTACSRDLGERARRLGARPSSLEVIPYGVDADRFRPGAEGGDELRAEFGVDEDTTVVLCVGRLVRKKGFGPLVDAVAKLRAEGRDAHLVMAGTGDLAAELRERARRHGIPERVRFLGDVPRPRMPALYRAADILAVPSVDAEGNVDGLPNVLLEGMASGVAVVASRIAGIPDVIRDGENGLLVEPGDTRELARALGELLNASRRRAELGSAARRDVEDRLNWPTVTGRYARVLAEAANDPRPPGLT